MVFFSFEIQIILVHADSVNLRNGTDVPVDSVVGFYSIKRYDFEQPNHDSDASPNLSFRTRT